MYWSKTEKKKKNFFFRNSIRKKKQSFNYNKNQIYIIKWLHNKINPLQKWKTTIPTTHPSKTITKKVTSYTFIFNRNLIKQYTVIHCMQTSASTTIQRANVVQTAGGTMNNSLIKKLFFLDWEICFSNAVISLHSL